MIPALLEAGTQGKEDFHDFHIYNVLVCVCLSQSDLQSESGITACQPDQQHSKSERGFSGQGYYRRLILV